ncbi:MAG: signal recognition particle-docking protein FtsY, partial [Cyanobacteriota bacterium]
MVYDWFNRGETSQPPEEPQQQPESDQPAQAAQAASGDVDQDALEWARQAYARLKAQQEADKQAAAAQAAPPEAPTLELTPPPEPELELQLEPEPEPAPPAGLSLLEQAAAQRAQRQQEQLERAIEAPPKQPEPEAAVAAPEPDEAAPSLGAFDEDFTWSAEVLAAQGRQLDQISLEEIDWLGRLRRGMEKTRQGFVTQLLDTLGDDPLTPEVLDDLESLLL